MKWINGPITNNDTNETMDVVVKSVLGCKPKDFAIGMGLVTAGCLYLCCKCFKNGALQADIAEFETLDALGLIKTAKIGDACVDTVDYLKGDLS